MNPVRRALVRVNNSIPLYFLSHNKRLECNRLHLIKLISQTYLLETEQAILAFLECKLSQCVL